MARVGDREFLDSSVLARLSRLTVNARIPMIGTVSGVHRSAHRGSSVEFAEYRKYVPGDDTRHVDWHVYARSDRFFVKEFEADTNLRCYIVLDASGSMSFGAGGKTKFDYARRAAATLAYLMMHQGDAVGLLSFAEKTVRDIPPRNAPSHLKNIFDSLAETRPSGETGIIGTLHDLAEKFKQRGMVIVFSDFFAELPALMDSFQHMRFRNHDLAVFHLLDRQEIDFRFDRPIRFVDMEGGPAMITDPSIVRDGYRRELDAYLAGIKKGCEEFAVDYHRVLTDSDYEKVLAEFLLQRTRKEQKSAG
ncbi:MAG: DUF58 domain-containing protein [Kiritimatiellia bacterium]